MATMDRTWFDGAGFGMFVHWDPASQAGLEVSWPMVGGVFSLPRCQSVPAETYWSHAATFDPRAWDPVDLARRARAAGMRYVVFTTRHHAGYSMWDTAHGDHKITTSPYGRDLLAELVAALRGEGLRVGFYYSLSDWHHPDYPPFAPEDLPYRFDRMTVPTAEQADRYRAYLMAQLRELLTDYGPVDVLWFDGQWERPARWWRPEEIAALARSLQPGILINDRLPGQGDFATPEQFVPPHPLEGRWESCETINGSWGWNPDDPALKSALQLVTTLCETVGRGGNLLLNVSPRGDGSLPPEQLERLDAITTWMERHHQAVHDVEPGLEPWQFYGPSTRTGATINLFAVLRPAEGVTVRGLPVRRVQSIRALGAEQPLAFRTRAGVLDQFLDDPDGEVFIEVPVEVLDPLVTVLTIELSDAPIDRAVLGRWEPTR